MFPVSKEALDLFLKNYRQTVEIKVSPAFGEEDEFTITESDIMLGGLTVDRYSVSGGKIELGSACASELALTLDNRDGRFNGVRFEGAELFVRLGVTKYDARRWEKATTQYVDLGYFTVDEPARALQTISLSALDRMVLFDKPVDWSTLTFPMTVNELLTIACRECNVPLGTNITGKPNSEYVIQSAPPDETTYRQIIQWVAEMTATCAFIDWEGKLCLSWYEPSTAKISPSERYSSDMLENDIVISGVEIVDDDLEVHRVGDDAYVFRIEGNGLIQHDYQSVCGAIYEAVGGFAYRPYECSTKPMPYLFPMDMVEYVDKDGVSHNTIVTNVTFTLNGKTTVMGQGETETNSGYAAANPMTKRELAIINTIKKSFNQALNSNVQSVLAFNELISNALGIYPTIVTNADGSKQYYMHDAPTLEESSTIYTHNAGGFAYTNNGWNDGNPIWQYGFDKNGNAIYNKVCAYGMEVSNPNGSYTTSISPNAFEIWRNGALLLEASGGGLDIYDGAITIYKNKGALAQPVLYFDQEGDIALSGYLTQVGNPSYRALVGTNERNNPGFYVYDMDSVYMRPNGTYQPYIELWRTTDGHTAVKGVNQLHLISESKNSSVNEPFITGYKEYAMAKTIIYNYDLRAGSNIVVDATVVGEVYWSNNREMCIAMKSGWGWGIAVGDYYRIYVDKDGGDLYGSWYWDTPAAVTSDENKKNSIEEIPEKYSALFDKLRPVRYKYNDGTSDRYHTGFIAQDVERALSEADIDSKDFAGFVRNDKDECFLRYEEFVALAVQEVQTLKAKNNALEQRVSDLENKLETLLNKLGG